MSWVSISVKFRVRILSVNVRTSVGVRGLRLELGLRLESVSGLGLALELRLESVSGLGLALGSGYINRVLGSKWVSVSVRASISFT